MENVIQEAIQELERQEVENSQQQISEASPEVVMTTFVNPEKISDSPASTMPRAKLREFQEVAIQPGSPLSPGNVVLLGTGDINKRYRQWLDNQFTLALGSTDPEKKLGKEKIKLQRFAHVLCTIAVIEDEVSEVKYTWTGPKFYKKHQELNIPKVVQEFIKDKKDILYPIAPFFGVKTNRKATVDTVVEEVKNEA